VERKLWREGIYDQIRDVVSMQGSLGIEQMCQLAPVSRAGFYRSLQEQRPVEEEMEVCSAIQQIVFGTSAPLRLSPGLGGVTASGHAGQSQTIGAHHAGRRPAGPAAETVRPFNCAPSPYSVWRPATC